MHFAGWMVFLYVGWTLLTISHIAWGVELSDDYHERARVAAYRQAAALLGGVAIVFIPVLSDQFGDGTETGRIANIGIFVMIALPVFLVAVMWSTPSVPARVSTSRHSWKDIFIFLRHNRSLRALLMGNMGILLGVAGTSKLISHARSNVH